MIKFIITVDKKFYKSFNLEHSAFNCFDLVRKTRKLDDVRLHIVWISAYNKYMQEDKQYEFLLRNELYG